MLELFDDELLRNIEKTNIISVSVSEYKNIPNLPGTNIDIKLIKEVFVGKPGISIYSDDKYTEKINPTKNELEEILLDYAFTRSARGDILIFYFSGHGYVSGNGDFGLCLTDSKSGYDNSGLLALSTLSFREIVKTLSMVDVFPCFIFDSCFSAVTTNVGDINVGVQIEYEASKAFGNSYAVVASSNADAFSKETEEGGFFTKYFSETILSGLPAERNNPHISLLDIPLSIDKKLSQIGVPLSRLNLGHAFPEIALSINKNYNPRIRTERFHPSYKELLSYAWNDGNHKCFTMKEIRSELPSGYGNHRKFEYIWGLLKDSRLGNGEPCRSLTDKAISFIKGEIAIYRDMQKDSEGTDTWAPEEGSEQIYYNDI